MAFSLVTGNSNTLFMGHDYTLRTYKSITVTTGLTSLTRRGLLQSSRHQSSLLVPWHSQLIPFSMHWITFVKC